MKKEQKEWADVEVAEVMDRAMFLSDVFDNVTLPFLRWRPGIDQPGLSWLATFAAMPMWGLHAGSPLVIRYWLAWIAASVVFRLSSSKREHSFFPGYPWLVQMFIPDMRAASLAEPLLVTGVGYLIPDKGLGWMLMAAGFAGLINEVIFRLAQERRRIEIANARHEMDQHQRLFK